MSTVANEQRIYFKNLDVVRFAAAISVVLAHGFGAWSTYFIEFRYGTPAPEYFGGWFKYLKTFFDNLGIGVEIFFFISGFLITYILLVEKTKYGKISYWRFFIRRALRIWPLYYLLLCLGPMVTTWMKIGEPEYWSLAFFYSNFEVIQAGAWQYPFAHFWSISLEEQFYVFWPPTMAVVKRVSLPFVLIALILVSIASRYYFFLESDRVHSQLYLNLLCRMDTLLIGGLIAWYYHKTSFKFALPFGVNFLLFSGLVTSFFFFYYDDWGTLWSALFRKYIYLAVFGAVILDYLFNPKYGKTHTFKKGIQYLGKISYGIYMYHNILLIIVIKDILLNNNLYSAWSFALVYLSSVILISILSFEFYEKHFLKLKERFAMVQTRKF